MGGGAPRERGRPARMLCRCVPLSFLGWLSRVGLHSMTSSQQTRSIGRCVYSWFVFINRRQFLPHNYPPGWPLITGH